VKTDTVTKSARTGLVRGTAALISATDTLAYYLIVDSIYTTRDSNSVRTDTAQVHRTQISGDSVRTFVFTPVAPASVTIDTAVFPPAVWLSGSWTAGYNGITYPIVISSALLSLDSVVAAPGLQFTATTQPPNASLILMSVKAPFIPEVPNLPFPWLRFSVISATRPTTPGSGLILIRVEGSSGKYSGMIPVQGRLVKGGGELRMGATLSISY
jgi:hypothetical protein